MKRLIALFLLIPTLCFADTAVCTRDTCPGESYEVSWMSPAIAGASSGAAAPVVILNETFEGSTACYSGATGNDATCVATWTVSGDSATWYHALQAGMPEGAGTYGLLHDTANEDTERVYWDNGSAIARATYNVDVEFSIYINSATVTDGSSIRLVGIGPRTGVSSGTMFLRIANTSGQLSFDAYGSNDSLNTNVSVNTKYTVKLHSDTTLTESYIQIDGGTQRTFSRSANDMRYVFIGSIFGEGADEAVSFEIGHITVTTYTD